MQPAPSYVTMSYDLFLLFLNDDCLCPQYIRRYKEHRKFQSYFSRSQAGFAFWIAIAPLPRAEIRRPRRREYFQNFAANYSTVQIIQL